LVDDRFRTAGLIGKDLLHRLEDALASQLREADLARWRIEHAGPRRRPSMNSTTENNSSNLFSSGVPLSTKA
jgi:hypothetical protein